MPTPLPDMPEAQAEPKKDDAEEDEDAADNPQTTPDQ